MEDLSNQDEYVFRALFENASEGLVVSDRTGRILKCNPRILEMFGYSMEELIGAKVELLLPVDLKKIHEKHRESYYEQPIRRTMGTGFDLHAQKKDGSNFPIEVSLNHFILKDRMYVMALLNDISKRKLIEKEVLDLNKALEQKVVQRTKELQNSQQLYSEIARNFPNGTINVLDVDFNYVFSEGSDLYQYGVTSEGLVGTNYIESMPIQVSEVIQEKLKEALAGNNQSFEVLLKRGAYLLNVVGLFDENNKIHQLLLVEQNITKQKEAEQKIKKLLENERELGDLKSRFVSMASHEFRTPLSTILSSSSLASKYIESDQKEPIFKHLKRIKTSVQNLNNILNDFLSLSKLEEGKISVQIELLSISDLAYEIVDELQELTKLGQKIELNISKNLQGIEFQTDRTLFKNICINLLSNAIKYSNENKPIDFFINAHEDRIHLRVKDQGIGIPEEDQKHLFERFFRAKNVINIQGTGLGLNIVKKYIDLLKGDISFISNSQEGTTFFVSLPIITKNYE